MFFQVYFPFDVAINYNCTVDKHTLKYLDSPLNQLDKWKILTVLIRDSIIISDDVLSTRLLDLAEYIGQAYLDWFGYLWFFNVFDGGCDWWPVDILGIFSTRYASQFLSVNKNKSEVFLDIVCYYIWFLRLYR